MDKARGYSVSGMKSARPIHLNQDQAIFGPAASVAMAFAAFLKPIRPFGHDMFDAFIVGVDPRSQVIL